MPEITATPSNDAPLAPAAIAPVARVQGGLDVRPATTADLPFIDALQKMHGHMVGWMPGKQVQGYIDNGVVLIAEEQAKVGGSGGSIQIGYVIARDQYMKRDELGIIYQLNVLPIRQRHLVGASLVKALFDRAPYGCKLFCCWCAQDIQANWFWESLGFVPLAFRTGSRAKQRIHIFWQRRVRENDDSTPYWFPAQTQAGAVGEDRIVLPIPPGTHWRDAKPMILPGLPPPEPQLPLTLPGGQPVRPRPPHATLTKHQRAAIARSQSKALGGVPIGKKAVIRGGRIKYVDIPGFDPSIDMPDELLAVRKPRNPKPRHKNDPKYIAAARELRDRFLEQINTERILPPSASGKYDVSRQLEAAPSNLKQTPLLKAA